MTPPPYPIPRDVVTPCASQPSWFFPPSGNSAPLIEAAKHMCSGCPFRSGCADWGIVRGEAGVWGATTEEERKTIRKIRRIAPIPVEIPRLVESKRPTGIVECGSYGAITRHRANKEPVCDKCRAFANEAKRKSRAKKTGEPAVRADSCALRPCDVCGKEMRPKSLPRHRRSVHSEGLGVAS